MSSAPPLKRLRTDGKFFARGSERVFLRTVTFGPFPPERQLLPKEEFPQIAAAGFNSIRLFELPDTTLLDAAAKNNLLVFAGLEWLGKHSFSSTSHHTLLGKNTAGEFLKQQCRAPCLGWHLRRE